jgi:hypothetical protein
LHSTIFATASVPNRHASRTAEGQVKLRDGKRRYVLIITFSTAEACERWQQMVLSALNAGGTGDAPEMQL